MQPAATGLPKGNGFKGASRWITRAIWCLEPILIAVHARGGGAPQLMSVGDGAIGQ
jgi:hypothetical protein